MTQSNADCGRFELIMQGKLTEQTGSPVVDEQAFVERHRAECGECRAVEQALSLLGGGANPALSEPGLSELALSEPEQRLAQQLVDAFARDQNVAQIQTRQAGRRTSVRVQRWVLPALAVAAAGLITVVGARRLTPPKGTGSAHAAPLTTDCLLRHPAQSSAALTEGRVYAADNGPVVWRVGSDLLLRVEGGTRLGVERLRADGVRLRLERGSVLAVLDPRQGHAPLAVLTSRGSIEVTGTIFAVNVEQQAARVHVSRGAVRARSKRGTRELEVTAGQSAVIGGQQAAPINAAWAARLNAFSQTQRLLGVRGASVLRVRGEPAKAELALDGVSLGRAPLVVRVRSGQTHLRVTSSGCASLDRTLQLVAGKTHLETFSLSSAGTDAATPVSASPAPRRSTGGKRRHEPARSRRVGAPVQGDPSEHNETTEVEPPTAAQLLASAQAARRARRWVDATRSYRQLVKRYASQAEGRAAIVSLGQLELGPLQHPERALELFDRYLAQRPQGAIAQEARFGRARSLRALGRRSAEIDALQDFLRRHPTAMQASAARNRLADLGAVP